MPTTAPVRKALFSEGEDETVDDDDDDEKTRERNDDAKKKSHSSVSSSSSLAAFLLESLRRKPEISIPVAFDKQKSGNSLIGPSALWWRDAFAISSSLLREEEGEGEEEEENVGKLLIYENEEAAMADLGHAAEACMEIARVVSGTLLEDLRRTTRSLEFWEEKRDEVSRGFGDVSHRLFLTLRCGPRAFVEETKGFVKRKAVAARRRAMYVSANVRRKSGAAAAAAAAATMRRTSSGGIHAANKTCEEKEREEEDLLETLLTVPPARAVIDGKVAALGKMQRSLASAVARVHARADDLVNGDYNRRKHQRKDDGLAEDENDEDEGLSEEDLRKREVEKTREAVERCVNGINEAIELVKSTAATLNAEHEEDENEDTRNDSYNNESEKRRSDAKETAEAKRNRKDDHDSEDHDEAVSPRRPSSSLERTISNSPLFAGMMHNRTNSLVSSVSRSGTPKIPDSPKSATQAHASSSRLSSSPQNNNTTPTLQRQNASLQRSNSYFQNLIKNTFLGDIFSSDGGTGATIGFVTHKLRTRLMAKSGEPIPFPLENDATWEAIVKTESRFEKARKAVDRTVERHRKPTKYERRWIPIALLSIVGVSSAIVLVRKSSLCGSTELDETLKAAYETTRTFFNSYMKTPSKELKQELTKAFDTGDREDAAARLDESQESLDRMLKEYVKNATKPGFSESLTRAYQSVGAMASGGGDEGASGGGSGDAATTANKIDPMSLVTARVEEELKAPLQNMLGGDLMQLLLIQTQVMKVEMEDALLQMDAVMRANRLNFALMACFPATLFVYGSVSFSKTVGAARAFQKRRKAREEMRLLVADAERSLMRLKMTRDEFTKRHRALEDANGDTSDSEDASASERPGTARRATKGKMNSASDSDLIRRLEIAEEHRRRRLEPGASLDANTTPSSRLRAAKNNFDEENLENETFHQGMLLYAVNALYASVQKHKRMFTPKEFRGVKLDAMALADVGVSIEGKLLTTARLARIYKGFQSEPHRVPSIVTGRYPI